LSRLLVVVGTQDGRKHVVRDREARIVMLLLDYLERIAARRHGTWSIQFNDAKLTPFIEEKGTSVNWAEEAREQSPSELEAQRRMVA
jgi:hypothetical protein